MIKLPQDDETVDYEAVTRMIKLARIKLEMAKLGMMGMIKLPQG